MRPGLTDADYAMIVKRYEDAGDVQNADVIRRQWEAARAGAANSHKLTAESPQAESTVKTWRERIGVGADYPLHAPTDVERAMVAEIAELRSCLDQQKGHMNERT